MRSDLINDRWLMNSCIYQLLLWLLGILSVVSLLFSQFECVLSRWYIVNCIFEDVLVGIELR